MGNGRWKGQINRGDSITLVFKLKLKESVLTNIDRKVPVVVGFNLEPFSKSFHPRQAKTIFVLIKDFEKIQARLDSLNPLRPRRRSFQDQKRFDSIKTLKINEHIGRDSLHSKYKIKFH